MDKSIKYISKTGEIGTYAEWEAREDRLFKILQSMCETNRKHAFKKPDDWWRRTVKLYGLKEMP